MKSSTLLKYLGGNFNVSRAQLFASLMADCDFMNLHTVGGLFTWRKNIQQGRHIRKKLDHCLADVDCLLLSSSTPLCAKQRSNLDFFLMCLGIDLPMCPYVQGDLPIIKVYLVHKAHNAWCSDESVMKREALSFFKNLFLSNGQCNPQSL